jgi:hypothetical protein
MDACKGMSGRYCLGNAVLVSGGWLLALGACKSTKHAQHGRLRPSPSREGRAAPPRSISWSASSYPRSSFQFGNKKKKKKIHKSSPTPPHVASRRSLKLDRLGVGRMSYQEQQGSTDAKVLAASPGSPAVSFS